MAQKLGVFSALCFPELVNFLIAEPLVPERLQQRRTSLHAVPCDRLTGHFSPFSPQQNTIKMGIESLQPLLDQRVRDADAGTHSTLPKGPLPVPSLYTLHHGGREVDNVQDHISNLETFLLCSQDPLAARNLGF